jgi:hypothetical protein
MQIKNMILFILIFCGLFLIEVFCYYFFLGGSFCNSPPSEKYEGAKKGIERYFLQTISWITIILGLIALEKNNSETLLFLFLSLIFFILSFRIGWFSGTKRIRFFIQQRLFNYSMIIAYYGIVNILFQRKLYELGYLSIIGLVILYGLELFELKGDLKIGLSIRKNAKDSKVSLRDCERRLLEMQATIKDYFEKGIN